MIEEAINSLITAVNALTKAVEARAVVTSPVVEPEATVEAPKPKREKKAKVEPVAAETVPAPVAAPAPVVTDVKEETVEFPGMPAPKADPTIQKVEPDASLTVDNVRAALKDYAFRFGMEKTTALVARFGVAKVSELKPEQYATFIAECAKG